MGRGSGGRKELQEAEYQNRKERMETGVTEGEIREAKAERKAPEEPPSGENGKKGKESTEG
ncbi:MAG: hypothetical protein IJZ38_05755 [Bacteroides sp.]|nr:hypothetical protein [Bacteroides sp.]